MSNVPVPRPVPLAEVLLEMERDARAEADPHRRDILLRACAVLAAARYDELCRDAERTRRQAAVAVCSCPIPVPRFGTRRTA